MTCVNLQTIYRVCEETGVAIGKTDLIRMVCNECADQEVCPVNSVYPKEDGSKADTSSQTTVAMNVHGLGSGD